MIALGFAVMAIAGTMVRVAVAQHYNSPAWPWGTLGVNVAGSFALGLLVGSGDPIMTMLGTGGLGSLTTFSTFGVELATMGRLRAVAYGAVTLTLGITAATAGLTIA